MERLEKLVWALCEVIPTITVDYAHHINASSKYHVQEYAELRIEDKLITTDYPDEIEKRLEQLCREYGIRTSEL
jgi:head-tail adaptor